MVNPMEIAMRDMSRLIDLANVNADTIPEVINANGPTYGAKGDGSDSTAALQKAIDAAHNAGRSEVYLSPGNYVYTTLTNTSGIVFVGDGVTVSGSPVIPVISPAQLNAQLAGIGINPVMFGADPAGEKDSTAAFQEAIDRTPAGGELLIPPGTFVISETLFREEQIRIVGSGMVSTTILYTGEGVCIQLGDPTIGIQFSDIYFKSSKGRLSETDQVAIKGRTTGSNRQIVIERCNFDGWSKAGFMASDSFNLAVRDCEFRSCGRDATGAAIIWNSVSWGLEGSNGNIISNTYFASCHFGVSNGIGVGDTGAIWNTVFENCIFEYCQIGINLPGGGGRNVLVACYFESNYVLGADIAGNNLVISPRSNDNTDQIRRTGQHVDVRGTQVYVQKGDDRLFRVTTDDGVTDFIGNLEKSGFSTEKIDIFEWAEGEIFAAGTYVISEGNIYISDNGGTSGSTQPTHTSGTESDGAIDWTYVMAVDEELAQGLEVGSNRTGNFNFRIYAIRQANVTGGDGVDNVILRLCGYSTYGGGGLDIAKRKDAGVAEIRFYANRSGAGTGTAQGRIAFMTGSVSVAQGHSQKPTAKLIIDSDGATKPADSNAYDLGTSSLLWREIYAANGAINTSDANDKTDIEPESLGLDFINLLTPRQFKFKESGNRDEENQPIPGVRWHHGLVAQEVEQVLDQLGIDHAALVKSPIVEEVPDPNWTPGEDETEDDRPFTKIETGQYRYGLRYTEFISNLIASVQELSQKCEALEQRVADLESTT